jgi:hypothetical protein
MSESNDPTGQIFVEADDDEPTPASAPEATAHRGGLRTATLISGRIVLGLITVGALAILVAASILLPLRGPHAQPVSTIVAPVPTVQQLVCPGGLLRIGSESGSDATTPSSLGAARIVSAAVPGVVSVGAFAVSDAGTGNSSAAPQLLSAPPVAASSAPPLVGGAQSESISTDEFFGLAAASCVAPAASTWLAGGATTVGRTTLLLLSNPTKVAAVVSLHIFGETGAVVAPGMDGIAVAPGAQRVLSISGFAPNVVSPVVHVQSAGGEIAATLEQTTVRGLTPGGVDFVSGTAAPSTTTVLPGIVISGSASMQPLLGLTGYADLATTLRIYLPAKTPVTASVSVIAENGAVVGTPLAAKLQPGAVTDVPLDQLSDGSYTVIVTAAQPVLASIRVATANAAAAAAGGTDSNGGTDFAWTTPAALLTSSVLVPVAPGMSATVHLENPSAAAETVVLHPSSGADISAVVPPGGAVAVPVSAARTYRISGFTELFASVSGAGDGEITSYDISPIERGEGPVKIYG